MPTTRKQKKARKSRGLEILSDIENLDIMLGENHFNDTRRDESLDGTSIRRQESITSNNLENEEMNLHSDHRNLGVGTSAGYDQNSASIDSQAEINKLSCELNSRISREMDEMMNSVSSQIQRAISDAINNQVLPQIQSAIFRPVQDRRLEGDGRDLMRDRKVIPKFSTTRKLKLLLIVNMVTKQTVMFMTRSDEESSITTFFDTTTSYLLVGKVVFCNKKC